MKLRKLNARGFSHHFVMALVVLICAIGGTYYLVASHADDTSTLLYLSPSSAPETVGNNFTVAIDLNANGNSINFTHAVIEYPSSLLACVSANSEPGPYPVPDSATCSNGEVTINQNLQNQNLSGTTASNVPVATITFRALAPGGASVDFVQGQTTVNIHQGSTAPSTGSNTGSGSGTAPIVAVPETSNAVYNISTTAQPSAPAAPTNLSATVVSSSQINLTWTPSPNPIGTVAGYYLYRYMPNVGTSTTILDATFNNPNTSSTAVTGLLAGSAYSFYLKAFTASSPSSPSLLSPASATVLAAIPSPPVAPPVSAAEQLSIPPQRRPVQYLSLCDVGKTGYVSDGTSNCWAGGSLLENYSPSVSGTYYDVPCVSVSANSSADRFVYIASGETCPEQTTPVPLQLGAGEQLSFPPAKRPATYLTQCTAGNTQYVSLNSCVYRLANTTYEFNYTPPVAGTYYSVPCATVTQGGQLRYLYVSAAESCPADTFGNLSPLYVRVAQPL